ncbi:MAG: efflux RND transporter periplasmic adaptor subunit [Rhodospirillales bacterium]|nr:efflux RND transporter periplasmic adaptor subunit [Rhodospirillales bacterium]
MHSIVAVIVVLLAAAGLGGGYFLYFGAPGNQAAGRPAGPPAGFAMPVEAAEIKTAPSRRQVLAVGTLLSNESVILRPEVSGRIVKINFNEGQKVKTGQVMVQLDSSIERAELAQAQAALALSRANFQRADELVKRGAGTQRALDEARAKLRTDEASLKVIEARLEKMTVNAPFDGIVGLREVSIGDVLSPGADIVNLEMIDPILVGFRVPEIFLASVRADQRIEITADAFPGRSFAGRVYAIDPLIDAAGRAIVIRAQIPNSDEMLRPGLFVRVALTIQSNENARWAPEQALIPVGTDHFVFKVVPGQQAGQTVVAFTRVRIGERRKGEVEIVDGLVAGDTVVTAGVLKIRDGVPVQIMPGGQPNSGNPPRTGAPAVAEGNKG